jgi:hypothetical protein
MQAILWFVDRFWRGFEVSETLTQLRLSYSLLGTDQHVFTQPFGAVTSNAQVLARSGLFILGNQNLAS